MINYMDRDSVIKHPYLVYNSNQDMIDKVEKNITNGLILSGLHDKENKTISILQAQINTEREKEKSFVEAIDNFFKKNNLFEDNKLLEDYQIGKYSQMMTLFDAFSQGIVTGQEDLKQALDKINEFYAAFNYNQMEIYIRDCFGDEKQKEQILQGNTEQAFNTITKYLQDKFNDDKRKNLMEDSITALKSQFYGKEMHLPKDAAITTKINPKYTNKAKNKSVFDQFFSDVLGMLRGLPTEIMVGRGRSTGTTTKKGLNPDTDAVVIFNADLQIQLPEIKQLTIAKTYEKLREVENQLGTDLYILHSSVKAGSGDTVKIKGEASFSARFEEIKDILHELKITNATDFLFLFANTIPGMAAENRWQDVKKTLLQLSTIYMFDDILPTVTKEITQETYNTKKINFYDIQGKILVASDIFQAMLNSITKEKAKQIVNIGGPKRSNVNYKQEVANITDVTSRWDKVYKLGMSKTMLNKFDLNVKNLTDLLLSF